jgi:hypothetical protein
MPNVNSDADTRFLPQGEAARVLEIPEATLRSWIRKFRPYTISHKDKFGHPLYDMTRLRELHYICGVWAKTQPRRSLDEVARELARRYPIEATAAGITPPPEPDFETLGAAAPGPTYRTIDPPTVDPQASSALAVLPDALGKLTKAVLDVEPLLARQVELAEEVAATAAKQAEIQAAILAYMQHHEPSEPWWRWLLPSFWVAWLWIRLNPAPPTDDHDDDARPPTPAPVHRQLVAPGEAL